MAYLKDFETSLGEDLRDPEFVISFLEACIEEGPEAFLAGVQAVVRANGGMSCLADTIKINRESAYRAFSREGNPGFPLVYRAMDALGYSFRIERKHAA